ncbi:MAG: HEAT repeat domain-containing protein [Planctomycetota bacterium]|jgi:hypothetical protein
MKYLTNGQDANRHPARFLTTRNSRGRTNVAVFLVMAVAVLVVILVVVLVRSGDKDNNPPRANHRLPPDGEPSGARKNIEIQFPAPKPDPQDPAYGKLQISMALYMAALEARSRALPGDFDAMEEASRKLQEALLSFGEVGDELLALLLGEFTHEKDPDRRARLMDLIIRFCDDRTARILLRHYNDLSPVDRGILVRGLAAKNMEGLEDIFNRLILGEKITGTKNNMLDYMLSKEDRNSPIKSRLFEMYDATHDAAFKTHILKSMTRYGEDAEVRDFYESVLNKEKLPLREKRTAMYSYAKSHGSDAVPQISKALYSDSYEMRASAIKALEYSGSDDALHILEDLARNDPDERIRKRAAESAKSIKNPKKTEPATVTRDNLNEFDKGMKMPQPKKP